MHQLHIYSPALILVPDTFFAAMDVGLSSSHRSTSTSNLVQYLEDEFPGVPVEPVMRKYWNEGAGIVLQLTLPVCYALTRIYSGIEFVKQLCVEDDERAAVIMATVNKYVPPVWFPRAYVRRRHQ